MREGWETTKLGAISEIFRGGSPRPIKSFITQEADGINWIKIGDTEVGGKYIYSTEEKIRKEGMRSSRYVEPGDFLLSNSMSFGRPYILKTDGCIHDGWLVIKKYDRSLVQDFLYYLLLSPLVAKQFEEGARGSTVRNLNTDIVSNVVVSYPVSQIEQQRIVDILDREFAKIDALKANAEKSLQAAKDLFKSALEAKVFAKGGSNRLLSSVCLSITDGDHMPPPKSTNGVPFITISNIDKNKYEIDFTDTFFVPETYFLNLKEDRKPKKGDVLYTVTGSFGIPVVISVDRDFCFQRHIALIRPNQSIVLPEFIFYWAMTRRVLHIADEVATGTAQRTVSLKSLRNFPIPVVSLDEQETIVDECKKLFSKGKVIQQNYQKTLTLCDDLKQSLLRKAFNGEL